MTVYRYKKNERLPIGNCSVAIGFFDGVHLAHRDLILTAVNEAKRLGIPSGAVTFCSDSQIKAGTPRLYSTNQRLSLIESLGVDFAVVCDFSEIACLSGEDFVSDVLVGDIGAVRVVAGFNFKFGKGASSDAAALCRYMSRSGGEAIIKEPFLFLGEPLSSTFIRGLLAEGKAEEACRALGAPYVISGVVEHGREVGRVLGFPTVNLELPTGRVELKRGVYRCAARVRDRVYHAVTNVGICPTFDKRRTHAETHLIDFSDEIYGEKVELAFLGYLREEVRFESPEKLKMQIIVDKKRTVEENGEILWQGFGLS